MLFNLQVLLPEQQLLASSETWTAVLAHIPDINLRQTLHSAWSTSKERDSADLNVARWKQLLEQLPKMQVRTIITSGKTAFVRDNGELMQLLGSPAVSQGA